MIWRRAAKILVFTATLCAAWLVAVPARADAPQCDHRGAITFAPAPQLQAIQLSIDVGPDATDACDLAFLVHLLASHDGIVWDTSGADPARVHSAAPEVLAPVQMIALCTYPAPLRVGAAAGVRDALERPPRM